MPIAFINQQNQGKASDFFPGDVYPKELAWKFSNPFRQCPEAIFLLVCLLFLTILVVLP